MFLFKKIEQKDVTSLKKFIKIYYIIWSAISAVNLVAGIVFAVFLGLYKSYLYLILMLVCLVSAVLFFSITLLGCVSVYSVINAVTEPHKESEKEKEFKKDVASILQLAKMYETGLIDEKEFSVSKRKALDKIYDGFTNLSKKEVLSKFLYLNKSGALSNEETETEKKNFYNETQYKKALILMRGGDYEEAKEIFQNLGDYKASKKMLKTVNTGAN